MSRIIIEGMTEDNKTFHPRNWIDRLSSILGIFGSDHRLRYSPLVQPQLIDGMPCLVVDEALRNINAMCFEFLIDFAKNNRLRIREESRAPSLKTA
jgi:hypothetical protein